MKKSCVLFMLLVLTIVTVKAMSQDVKLNDQFKHLLKKNDIVEHLSHVVSEKNVVSKSPALLRSPQFTNEELELLDSVVVRKNDGHYQSKTVYEYDNQGKRILEATYNWVANPGKWVGNRKVEYVRGLNEENDQTVLRTNFRWSLQSDDWLPIYQFDEVLHGSSNIIKVQIENLWDETINDWVKSSKSEQFYDDDNNYMTLAHYSWDAENEKWVGFRKTGYTYSEDEVYIKFRTSYGWNDEEAIWSEKELVELDRFGNVLSESNYIFDNTQKVWKGVSKTRIEGKYTISYTWNDVSADWLATTKIVAEYDEQNREIYYESYTWDDVNSSWVGERYEKTTYDLTGNNISTNNAYFWSVEIKDWILTFSGTYSWTDSGDDNWLLLSKLEIRYNQYGSEISREQMYRSNWDQPWYEGYTWKTENEYDEENLLILREYYMWCITEDEWLLESKAEYNRNENGSLSVIYYYDRVGNDWVKNRESVYFYSTIVLGNNAPAYTIELKSYPNPVKDSMTITGTKSGQILRILDAAGRLLGTYTTQGDKMQINTASFADGVLFVNIEKETLKVVKSSR